MQPLAIGGTVGDRTQQEEKSVKTRMRHSHGTKGQPVLTFLY